MKGLSKSLSTTLFGMVSLSNVMAQPKNFGSGSNLAVAASDGENTIVLSGTVGFDRFTDAVLEDYSADKTEIYQATAAAMGSLLSENGFNQTVSILPSLGGGFAMQQSLSPLFPNRSLGLDPASLTVGVKNASNLLSFYSLVMNSSQFVNFTGEVSDKVSELVRDLTEKRWREIQIGGMMLPIFIMVMFLACGIGAWVKERRENRMRAAAIEGERLLALEDLEGAVHPVAEDAEGAGVVELLVVAPPVANEEPVAAAAGAGAAGENQDGEDQETARNPDGSVEVAELGGIEQDPAVGEDSEVEEDNDEAALLVDEPGAGAHSSPRRPSSR